MYSGIKKHKFTEHNPPKIPKTAFISGKIIEITQVRAQKTATITTLA